MTFNDILKKSFLDGYSTSIIGTKETMVALLITSVFALYIFYCYRLLTQRTFYSKAFSIALAAIAVITSAIILTIQSSVVVSLGMVGALSIVRFRTAIKDPLDLVFLFWSISVGIICGSGIAEIAVILSLILTILLFVLDKIPVAYAPMILVINAHFDESIDAQLKTVLLRHIKHWTEKSRSLTNNQLNLVIELKVRDGASLTQELSALDSVFSVSLLKHDGEVTF